MRLQRVNAHQKLCAFDFGEIYHPAGDTHFLRGPLGSVFHAFPINHKNGPLGIPTKSKNPILQQWTI